MKRSERVEGRRPEQGEEEGTNVMRILSTNQ